MAPWLCPSSRPCDEPIHSGMRCPRCKRAHEGRSLPGGLVAAICAECIAQPDRGLIPAKSNGDPISPAKRKSTAAKKQSKRKRKSNK